MKDGFLKIQVNGCMECLNIDRDKFSDSIHRLIDCDIWEGVPVHVPGIGSFYMMLDENGKIKNPPKKVNALATLLYNNSLDYIVGDVIIGELKYVPSDEPDIPEELDVCPIDADKLSHLFNYCMDLYIDFFLKGVSSDVEK